MVVVTEEEADTEEEGIAVEVVEVAIMAIRAGTPEAEEEGEA